MGIVVQKFGGTSLRNLSIESDFLKHIEKAVNDGHKLVVVVSAMGRAGEPYATDTLIKQLENIYFKIDPKKKDLIMSCGETISAAMVSHLLEAVGLSSEPLMGFQAGIITDENFNSGKILDINTNKILRHLNKNKIVVVAGFQGMTNDMEITTLGRGGSDTTAVALGGFLQAERVEIFTDVPGVAMTDPRIIPDVKYIKEISYDDMYRLASNGATVIHPKAVELGKNYKIPIRVLSTFLDGPGTLISNLDGSERIIGIGLKRNDNIEVVSLIFNEKYKEEIEKKLKEFIRDKTDNIIEYNIFNDKAIFSVRSEIKAEFVQELYDYYIE